MTHRRGLHALALLLLGAMLVSTLPRTAAAQTQDAVPVQRLTTATAEIWPDFDDPSVLVLLTAALPAEAMLPARLTVPVPDDARINAVARMDEQGRMFEDIQYQRLNGQLILTLDAPMVRVEYYYPYESDGDTRQFTYEAPSGLVIDTLIVSVQEPALATSLTTDPAPTDQSTDSVGLTYDNFVQSVAAGDEPLTIDVSYTMVESTLTVDTLEPVDQSAAPVPTQPAGTGAGGVAATDEGTNWLLFVLGGVGLLISGLFLGSGIRDWQRSRQRKGRTPAKPRPRQRPTRSERAPAAAEENAAPQPPASGAEEPRFCHQCGAPVNAGEDRFCRRCGTKLKGR